MNIFTYGTLTNQNAEAIAERIRQYLGGKVFAIASAHNCDRAHSDLRLETDCTLEADWVNSEKEPVRVFRPDNGSLWLGFSAGHYFWSFTAAPDDRDPDGDFREHPYFAFDRSGMRIEFRSPSRALHRHCFRVQESADERRSETNGRD